MSSEQGSAARERLIRRVMEHASQHGIADLSMRDLAAAVGTSHRMLNYHFGGRAGLLAAIVSTMEADQRALLGELARDAANPAEIMVAQWEALTTPEVLGFVRLFFEILALAAHERPGTEGFLEELVDPWVATGRAIAATRDLEVDEVEIRLGMAVIRGLLVDVLASGELTTATAALHRFLGRGPASSAAPST